MKDEVLIREIHLEKIKIGLRRVVSKYLLDSKVDIEQTIQGDVEIALRGYVFGERADILQHQFPSDWWQHFKERWFPHWLKRRFPVKYKKWVVEASAVYPNFRPSLPHETHTIILAEREY